MLLLEGIDDVNSFILKIDKIHVMFIISCIIKGLSDSNSSYC